MKWNAAGLLLGTVLAACGSGDAPFGEDTVTSGAEDGSIESDRALPPGTASPESSTSIFRREALDEDNGNGFARNISYNAEDDTFSVDNLPFDGTGPYIRGTAVGSFGDYAVYEAVAQSNDAVTESTINQLTHRAIYGISRSGETEFAIVRTGAYQGYGFGGFVYERNGTVILPTSGQARFDGTGAGLRDYIGRGGLDYIAADVQIALDFDDFNEDTGVFEGAVDGFIFNKRIFNLDGDDETASTIARINEGNNASLSAIPTTVFSIGPNALDENGEITGEVTSPFGDNSGTAREYGTGTYFGVVSGEGAEQEIVGIVVTESSTDTQGVTVRDTIGFTIYRDETADADG
ncbi:MAG: hypothetical protein AAF307_05665 [Pseudomonadota bacterium]